MSRTVAVAATLALALSAACSKKEAPKAAPAPVAGGEVIAPPPGETIPPPPGAQAKDAPAEGAAGARQAGEVFKLKPEEGHLSIELPEGAKAGVETVAKVIVKTSEKYKINFEFPTKLSLTTGGAVDLAKGEMKAGGPDKAQGDAEKLEEKQLVFAVKLTPTAAGTHVVNGSFKFAVCDKDECLPKREAIAIQVAAQ